MKQYLQKLSLNFLFWLALKIVGGYPPKEAEAFRRWALANAERVILPTVTWTETKIDDELYKIFVRTLENDSAYAVIWQMLQNKESIPDGVIQGTEAGFLKRIRERVAFKRAGVVNAEYADEQEAESVALVVMILGIVANGPLALKNVRELVDRIRARRAG